MSSILPTASRQVLLWVILISTLLELSANTAPAPNTVHILSIEGRAHEAQFQRPPSERWDQAFTNTVLDSGNFFRTGLKTRATLQFSDLETLRVREYSTLRIRADRAPRRALEFVRGVFYFFHRDKPNELEIRTRVVTSVVRGTEFVVTVAEDGTTRLDLLDGEVDMENEFGSLELKSGEAALVEPGKAPQRTARIDAVSVIQWCLYYPAVLNLDDLSLDKAQNDILRDSLVAYREGDLLGALAKYPEARVPVLHDERLYLAALLLSVGEVEETEKELNTLSATLQNDPRLSELVTALRTMIAAVQGRAQRTSAVQARLSTSLLAESYVRQAQLQLDEALELARKALAAAPNFAFAQVRVAELEFGFGRSAAARKAVETGLQLAPRNAQAAALHGFLLAADNKFAEAEWWFEHAIALDGGLGNGWLGRGLCRIHGGKVKAGMQDLQVAATVEPQRALLRSYLGKAFSHAGENSLAVKELALAKQLDPHDPTAWVYSALLYAQSNRLNQAVRDLEHATTLNTNRGIFRSRLLLEQDRAVQSANLAQIYDDAGMNDVSVQEAARGLSADYASYSAHLFLANSYDRLRDPYQVNLRYETAWLNEYLMANLLAPASAGTFSPAISQQEYSRLFERNRLGVVSATDYFSNGDWVQSAAQYGILGTFSYSLDAHYRSELGERPNADLELLTLSLRLKYQITPRDGVYFQAIYYGAESGDVAPYYDASNALSGLRVREREEPILLAGYHREWSPENHTLFLAGRLQDELQVGNADFGTFLIQRNPAGDITRVTNQLFNQRYESDFEIYTAEAQQIWRMGDHLTIAGARYQIGEFSTQNALDNARPRISAFPVQVRTTEIHQAAEVDFERAAGYLYHHWQLHPVVQAIGGVSYDYLKYPDNFRYAPVNDEIQDKDQLSPKAGVVWTPNAGTSLRVAYARALGGVSFDQSFQLEPTQVAGFNQAYRSIMPEAVTGANAAPELEICGLSVEQRLSKGTYLSLAVERLSSEVNRTVGVAELFPVFVGPGMEFEIDLAGGGTRHELDFEEHALTFTANQLIGDELSIGARYRLSRAALESRFPELSSFDATRAENFEAILHELNLFAVYNHPSGIFSQFESIWMQQDNRHDLAHLEDESFWHFNVFAGFRFPGRRAEVRLGVLNLTDQDYHLHPLNLTAYLRRERTFTASLRFSF